MEFKRTESGIYIPTRQASETADAKQDVQQRTREKSKIQRMLRASKDYLIVGIQLATVFILYLNYVHTVVPTEQRDQLAEQVAGLQTDAKKAEVQVKQKLASLHALQDDVAQSNAKLLQLRSNRDALKQEIDGSRLFAKRAKKEADQADDRLKRAASSLEVAQWSIFHQRVSLEQLRPVFSYTEAMGNSSLFNEQLTGKDPIDTIVMHFAGAWPDTEALARQVATSIRKMRSDLFPARMSEQYADVYVAEAKALRCERPDFVAIKADYENRYSAAKVKASDDVINEESSLIAEAEKANEGKKNQVRFVVSNSDHQALLTRATVNRQVDTEMGLQKLLFGKGYACVTRLSKIGNNFLEKKDSSPQKIPKDLLP